MDKRVQIVLLGLMIWVLRFMAGGIGFTPGVSLTFTQILGLEVFSVTIGLALALFLVFRDKRQNYKRTGWEAGIAWYVILLLMDLILIIGFIGLQIELWYPLILFHFQVVIIPIVVGYLLAELKSKV
ncbi:MAG: hypothetical protein HeimC3_21460 [Candidatus Heimdallarchaeota archaeon LC_3]|nr:MAG: hypothetical protein HeimC3_21460 [Candidatus Heimdallarchaeota archaeon LC_3]